MFNYKFEINKLYNIFTTSEAFTYKAKCIDRDEVLNRAKFEIQAMTCKSTADTIIAYGHIELDNSSRLWNSERTIIRINSKTYEIFARNVV